jgi:hypothetical protein
MNRWKIAVTTGLLGAVGVLGLSGCGAAGTATDTAQQTAVDVAAAMGADGQALAAMGFDTEAIAAADPSTDPSAPSASPSAAPGKGNADQRGEGWRKRHQARVLLRKNTLHGEVVVQTKDGTKTVAVQRGTVTAIDDKSMTVKSTDGFTLTWTFGPELKVVEKRTTIQASDVKVGAELGVAGTKDGDQGVARLVVIPNRK